MKQTRRVDVLCCALVCCSCAVLCCAVCAVLCCAVLNDATLSSVCVCACRMDDGFVVIVICLSLSLSTHSSAPAVAPPLIDLFIFCSLSLHVHRGRRRRGVGTTQLSSAQLSSTERWQLKFSDRQQRGVSLSLYHPTIKLSSTWRSCMTLCMHVQYI